MVCMSPIPSTGHQDIVQIPEREKIIHPLSEVDSAFANNALPSTPRTPAIVESASKEQETISILTATPDKWPEPELKKITATVSFPRTKTYKPGESFVVTLAVIKEVNQLLLLRLAGG